MSPEQRKRIAVVGGGMLGLTLSHRLAQRGHTVDLFEADRRVGGLSAPHDYGRFTWDRFYHCILPQDRHLLRLITELGLEGELRWRVTKTGYFAGGRFYSMSGNLDFLLFPLLSPLQKARLAALVLYATRFADPHRLEQLTAAEWLQRICGRRAFEVFWRPLLRAKFGPFQDQVAASFIWATLTRLFGARREKSQRERLGYVRGGYARILERFVEELEREGVRLHLRTEVRQISRRPPGRSSGEGCQIVFSDASGENCIGSYDQVLFTGPTPAAKRALAKELLARVETELAPHPATYLGVACLTLVLPRPLTPYYVLNLGDEDLALTGVVELTNLVERGEETAGLSLIYLPHYLSSDGPRWDEPDEVLSRPMIEHGLKRLFPHFDERSVIYRGLHKARFVQALPLKREGAERPRGSLTLRRPFQIVNASMLDCATLNNNEVLGLAERFLEENRGEL